MFYLFIVLIFFVFILPVKLGKRWDKIDSKLDANTCNEYIICGGTNLN